MNTTGKWLTRAGALFIMLGFVLPSLTVSCSAMPGVGQSFSLVDLTGQADQPLLFLVPLGALVSLILSFIPMVNRSTSMGSLLGQFAGVGVGALSIIITLMSLNNQVNRFGGFDIAPEFGLFVLLIGYGLAGTGLVIQWQENSRQAPPRGVSPQVDYDVSPHSSGGYGPALGPPVHSDNAAPRIEVVLGSLPAPVYFIESHNFTIGRSSENDLQVPDSQVSRHHAILRFAQGKWFIQDQGSSGGTIVNGRPVDATQINSGDMITLGNTTFTFRA